MNLNLTLKQMTFELWESVAKIYGEGIATGNATFETEIPNWEKWDSSHLSKCRLVCYSGDTVVGWAALSPVSNRCIYSGVTEVSIYVGDEYRGQGVGSFLLGHLIKSAEKEGFWTLQSGIMKENTSSLSLHQKHGFRVIGEREKIGKLHGIWRNIILIERRSKVVGIN